MELVVDNIRHKFGELAVLDGISFTVAEGEILAVIGPSGCGKSTLLSILGGITAGDSWQGLRLRQAASQFAQSADLHLSGLLVAAVANGGSQCDAPAGASPVVA